MSQPTKLPLIASALAVLAALLALAFVPSAQARYGDFPQELVEQTNNNFGDDCFWQGPRGLQYGKLPNATAVQKANLYPDGHGSYWFANFAGIPQGTTVKVKGQFPHSRYSSLALLELRPNGSTVSTDENISDHNIVPDVGSTNPFVPGNSRNAENRDYTVDIVAEDPPADPAQRPANTLYLGADGTATLGLRVILPDAGLDGTGGVGLPNYDARIPGVKKLKGEEVCDSLVTPITQPTPPGATLQQWLGLRSLPYGNPPINDPDTMPARNPSVWEKFWNGQYSLAGPFFPPAVRATFPITGTDLAANKDTTYLVSYLSRKFGPVYVIRGKMPTVPKTYEGQPLAQGGQERYWSLCQNDALPSGQAYDCIADFQVPLDDDGNYTIVVSREEDRPSNATDACKIGWLDYGTQGEGIPAPYNRPDFGLMVMRFELEDPGFANGGQQITAPGMESVMGPYLPQGDYTTKAAFEAGGCS